MTRYVIVHTNGNYLRRTVHGHYVWTEHLENAWLCLSKFLAKDIAKNFKDSKGIMEVEFVPGKMSLVE